MLPLNDEQRILVEENMGLVGKVIKDCLQNPSAQGCYHCQGDPRPAHDVRWVFLQGDQCPLRYHPQQHHRLDEQGPQVPSKLCSAIPICLMKIIRAAVQRKREHALFPVRQLFFCLWRIVICV